MKPMSIAAAVWIVFLSAGSAITQEWTPQREHRLESKPEYSPYVDSHYPQRVYWGDTHHHSSYSFDSGMFGNLEADEVERPDFAEQGYRRGVPMGGDLTDAPADKAPNFIVRALRDPDGANLDRIQIIKGWVDAKGQRQERVHDVAVSDGRTIGSDGRCKTPVGSTVDVPNADYTNSIGDAMLMGYWQDPGFDAALRAFYYVRVIEIPTPRWTAYDAKRFGIEMAEEVRMTIQDRAYTSPIWYTP